MLILPRSQVHLWYMLTEEVADAALLRRYETLLSSQEKERRACFSTEGGRREFLLTRALLRTVLSLYAGVPATTWRFKTQTHGRPEIDTPSEQRKLRFNLSHTKGLIACVMACEREVGVDVEDTERSNATEAIAKRFLAPAEVAALSGLSPESHRWRFYEFWTLKESYIKARGEGLALPLRQFAFSLGPGRQVAVRFDACLADDPAAWQFHLWRPSAVHQGAVAIRKGLGPKLRMIIRKTIPRA